MTGRVDFNQYLGSGMTRALLTLQREIEATGLDHSLIHLVKIRASQMNGCAYCIDMHTKEARAAGEKEQRIYALDAWRETPFFNERERVALEWTEAVTNIAETHVPDDLYERTREQFSEAELVALNFAVIAINAWNRIAITFRAPVGTYQPAAHASAAV